MPIFDFRCETEDCSLYNQTVELLVNVSDTVQCNSCGNTINKLVSAPHGRVIGGTSRVVVRRGQVKPTV